MWCALVFPVIVPQLALLVRFSKISCRWDYSSTLGPEACGLCQCFVKTPSIRQTRHANCGAGPDLERAEVPTQWHSWEPGRPSLRQEGIHGSLSQSLVTDLL